MPEHPPDQGQKRNQTPTHTLFELDSPQTAATEENWLLSYLDVLTLLITFFVLLISLSGLGRGSSGTEDGQGRSIFEQLSQGLQPLNSGLEPQFEGLDIEGVSVVREPGSVSLRIEERLLFASGAASLSDEGQDVLSTLAGILSSMEGLISVEGHTDNLPIRNNRFPSNWELSAARASAVLRALVSSGFQRDRLRAIGYADTRPVSDNDSAAGRQANRRVELVVQTSP